MCTHHVRRADVLSTELKEYRDRDLDLRKLIRDFEEKMADLQSDRYALETALRLTADTKTRAEQTFAELRSKLAAEEMSGIHCAEMAKATYGCMLNESVASIRAAYEGCAKAQA